MAGTLGQHVCPGCHCRTSAWWIADRSFFLALDILCEPAHRPGCTGDCASSDAEPGTYEAKGFYRLCWRRPINPGFITLAPGLLMGRKPVRMAFSTDPCPFRERGCCAGATGDLLCSSGTAWTRAID